MDEVNGCVSSESSRTARGEAKLTELSGKSMELLELPVVDATGAEYSGGGGFGVHGVKCSGGGGAGVDDTALNKKMRVVCLAAFCFSA